MFPPLACFNFFNLFHKFADVVVNSMVHIFASLRVNFNVVNIAFNGVLLMLLKSRNANLIKHGVG